MEWLYVIRKKNMKRRSFIKNTSLATAGLSLAGNAALYGLSPKATNPLPRWKGFNLLDFFSPDLHDSKRLFVEDHFRWMADWGFDFVRIPMACI